MEDIVTDKFKSSEIWTKLWRTMDKLKNVNIERKTSLCIAKVYLY